MTCVQRDVCPLEAEGITARVEFAVFSFLLQYRWALREDEVEQSPSPPAVYTWCQGEATLCCFKHLRYCDCHISITEPILTVAAEVVLAVEHSAFQAQFCYGQVVPLLLPSGLNDIEGKES